MENNIFNSFEAAMSALNAITDEEALQSSERGDCVVKTVNAVMAAYQNANKWLDSVKEAIYINMNCPFFSSFVHTLAHTMPARFDKFGDILHTINMEIPYPATAEISKKPTNLNEAFTIIFSTLDAIKVALNAFIKCTDEKYHGMACAAEACLNDIEGEYPMLYRLQAKAKECGEDTITFDKFVGQYNEHKGDLLESLNEAIRVDEIEPIKYRGLEIYTYIDEENPTSKPFYVLSKSNKDYKPGVYTTIEAAKKHIDDMLLFESKTRRTRI